MITPTTSACVAHGANPTRVGALLQRGRHRRRRLAQLRVGLVVVGEPFEKHDRVALRRAVAQADDRKPAHGVVRVAEASSCSSGPHRVDVARARSRERPSSAMQRRAAAGRALVLEPAPQQLELLSGSGTARSRGRRPRGRGSRCSARRASSSSSHSLRRSASSRSSPALASASACAAASASVIRPPTSERGAGPTYSRRRAGSAAPSRFCSRMCADQPAMRAQANIAGAERRRDARRSRARPPTRTRRSSPARGRAGARAARRARRCSSSSATSKRGEPSSLRRAPEEPRARVLGAVDAVAEAHQPLAACRAASLT